MSTLRQAVQDYIEMRRGLGFKLRETERGLIDFVTFLEANDTPYVTTDLALAWARRPSHAQPARWATRLGYVRGFARHRTGADPRTLGSPRRFATLSPEAGTALSLFKGRHPAPLVRSARDALPIYPLQAQAMDVLLPVRIAERFRPAPRRSSQP